MRFLKRIFRHRYRIDLLRDGRYVVLEKAWWHVFGPYLSIGSADTLRGAHEIVGWHRNQGLERMTLWKN